MKRSPQAWFVVADGARARILARRPDGSLATVCEVDAATAHSRARDLGSDRPGRAHESTGAVRHAVEPPSDPHDKAKHDFARLLAEQVNEAAARDEFMALSLVAPSPILAEIKGHLAAAAAARLVGTVPKDLTKLPDRELHERLATIGGGQEC